MGYYEYLLEGWRCGWGIEHSPSMHQALVRLNTPAPQNQNRTLPLLTPTEYQASCRCYMCSLSLDLWNSKWYDTQRSCKPLKVTHQKEGVRIGTQVAKSRQLSDLSTLQC